MSLFFPRFQHPQHSHSVFPRDVFRLLEDLASADPTSSESARSGTRGFTPNFDVQESEHEYTLEGELPGLTDKKNVSLEFTDDKTLYIHGRIERSLKRYSDDQGRIQTIEGGGEEEKKKIEGGGEKQEKQKESEKKESEKKEKYPKYWVSERTVGEFSRSFSFPTMVDVDNVKASLDNGILKIVVPKKEKQQGRKIEIK